MKSFLPLVLAFGAFGTCAGCGTLNTTADPNSKFGIYSGTKASAEGNATQWDVPFSLVADTILLPITIPLEVARRLGATEDKQAAGGAGAK